jgi:hypothetical protein
MGLDTRQWASTFVRKVLDAQSFVSCARHHTSSCEKRIVDRIGRDVGVAISEVDIDYDQVVNMVQMISNLSRGNFAANAAHNEIARRPIGNLIGNMAWYIELTIGPAAFELWLGQFRSFPSSSSQYLHALCANICPCASHRSENPRHPQQTRR